MLGVSTFALDFTFVFWFCNLIGLLFALFKENLNIFDRVLETFASVEISRYKFAFEPGFRLFPSEAGG